MLLINSYYKFTTSLFIYFEIIFEASFLLSYQVMFFRNLPFLSDLVSSILIATKYECLSGITFLFIKPLNQINSSFPVLKLIVVFPFDSSHIRYKFKLNFFPIENPSKLSNPFLGCHGARHLQYLKLRLYGKDLVILLNIVMWIIVNPQNYVFFECYGRRYFC